MEAVGSTLTNSPATQTVHALHSPTFNAAVNVPAGHASHSRSLYSSGSALTIVPGSHEVAAVHLWALDWVENVPSWQLEQMRLDEVVG